VKNVRKMMKLAETLIVPAYAVAIVSKMKFVASKQDILQVDVL